MKKKYLIILLLTMIIMPFKVFAAGGFGVSSTSISMYPGESKTITISTNNAVGKLNISSSNGGVASVNPGSIFTQNPGSSGSITITGNSVGTATISVVASDNFATMDEEILAGQTKTITVNVIAKPTPQPDPTPSNPTPSNPQPSQPQNNLSSNNNIKSLSIDGYELVKVDNNNYTLTVSNDVTSVNVNANAEDSKAKVSGTGTKELQVGENNIEVIITSESGSQNKITIKVTRKDGYYLEDLDAVLKNEKLQDADIIISADSKITKDQLNQIKNSKKTLRFNYYDESKNLIYSWTINGKEIKDDKEFTTSITFATENVKEIYKLSNYADGLYVNFKHTGDLPKGTKIKLYVGDKFEDESIVNVYHYNNTEKTLDFIKDNLKVTDGYIEFDVEHCSEYFVTMSTIGNVVKKDSSSIVMMILVIIELIIILALVAFMFIKFKTNKKNNLVSEVENTLINPTDNFADKKINLETITSINDSSIVENDKNLSNDNLIGTEKINTQYLNDNNNNNLY